MAQNLQRLKRRIKTAENISQIAKAMEMISASKIKRAQTAVENNKPYAERVARLTSQLTQSVSEETYTHPYIKPVSDSHKRLVIAISPNKGLCGGLNTNLFKKLFEIQGANDYLVTIGEKVSRFAPRLTFDLLASFQISNNLPSYTKVFEILRVIEEYYNSHADSVDIVYTRFDSFFTQAPVVKQLLPIERFKEETADVLPYVFEPNVPEILDSLLPYYLETQLYSALLNAYTAEQAARMMAMQNAKNNALDIADVLTLSYNKSRQERITNEILDITNTIL